MWTGCDTGNGWISWPQGADPTIQVRRPPEGFAHIFALAVSEFSLQQHHYLKRCKPTKALSFCWSMCPFSFLLFVCFHFRVSSAGQFRKTSILLIRVNMKAAASSTRSRATSASCAALRSASPWAWRWTVSYWKLMFNNCIYKKKKKIHSLSRTVRNQHGTCCGNILPSAKQFYVELWCIPEELVSSFWSPQNVSPS